MGIIRGVEIFRFLRYTSFYMSLNYLVWPMRQHFTDENYYLRTFLLLPHLSFVYNIFVVAPLIFCIIYSNLMGQQQKCL